MYAVSYWRDGALFWYDFILDEFVNECSFCMNYRAALKVVMNVPGTRLICVEPD